MSPLDYSEDILIKISQYLSFDSLLAWSLASRAHHETLTRVILHKLGPCQYRPLREWRRDISFTASFNPRGRPYNLRLRGGELHPAPRLSRGAVLVWAASRGHVRLAKSILSMQKMGSWINTPILSSGHGTSLGSFGMTPLHAAAKGGHADVVNLLIEYGADVEATVAGNLRPIHFASNQDVVMALVRHGSSIHPQGKSTVPPLTYVLTTRPHLSTIQCLLRLGCNPNAATWLGFTAVDAAVQTGNIEALQFLLDAGLDVSPSVSRNNSLIYKAIYCHKNYQPDLAVRLVRLLMGHETSGKGDTPEYSPRDSAPARADEITYLWGIWAPFLTLFQQRPSLFISLLLDARDALAGCKVQDAGWYLSMASSLLDHGASLDVHRESSMLLKFFLSHEDNFPEALEQVLMFLLYQLAGVPLSHGQNPVTRQPIHILFTRGYNFFDTETNIDIGVRLLERLLHLGADPNEPDSEGNTPLALLCQLPFHACENQRRRYSEAAQLLLCNGADINTLWETKNCAIYRIVAQATTWKRGQDVYSWYFESRSRRDCNLEHRDSDGMTPLGRLAAIQFPATTSTQWWYKKKQYFAWRRADFLRSLLRMRADVHAIQGTSRDKPLCAGGTPLHFACYDFDPAMLRMLLDFGATEDVNRLTDTGFTPLMLLAAAASDGVLGETEAREMEQLLQDVGAN